MALAPLSPHQTPASLLVLSLPFPAEGENQLRMSGRSLRPEQDHMGPPWASVGKEDGRLVECKCRECHTEGLRCWEGETAPTQDPDQIDLTPRKLRLGEPLLTQVPYENLRQQWM